MILGRLGRLVLALGADLGGIAMLSGRSVGCVIRGKLNPLETIRCLYQVAVQSLLVVSVTALFAGAIMVVQAGSYIQMIGAYDLLGWGAGFVTFREVAPALIGLMFSGRVGANNTAELGGMVLTEQVDALRTMAIDPIAYLVVPRTVAMIVGLFCLTVLGNAMALLGGALTGRLLLNVDFVTYFGSFLDYVHPADLWIGLIKGAAYGGVIALVSCWYGLSVTGGAQEVGKAVNRSVVASAVGILIVDFFITFGAGT